MSGFEGLPKFQSAEIKHRLQLLGGAGVRLYRANVEKDWRRFYEAAFRFIVRD